MKDRDLLFGTLAIKKGYISTDQVAACIRDQAQYLQQGKTLRLGQVMVRNNLLTATQFMEILEQQEQQILVCPTCGKRYNVKHHRSGKKVRCRGCKGILTVPTDLDEILESELIEISTRGGTSVIEAPRDQSSIRSLADEQETLPATFGRYQVIGEIGRGGMGVVYKAYDPEKEQTVALKLVRKGTARQEEVAARFQRETQALQKLRHPSIIRVLEIGVEQKRAYYTMKFIDGVDLEGYFKSATSPEPIIDLLLQVAEALGEAHEQRIIHRDIKPANILIDAEGIPYLTDFGLARDLDAETVLTRPGEIVGTPHYMSPEQILGDERNIGPPCDVYALGILLYRVITGELPHAGNSVIELYSQVLEQEPRPPRELAPDLDPRLEAVILKAIEKEPSKRYATATELAQALRSAISEPSPASPQTNRSKRASSIRPTPLLAGLGLALFAIGLFLGWVIGWRSKGAESFLQAAESGLATGSYRESLTYFEKALTLSDSDQARHGRVKAQLAIAALETREAMSADRADHAAARLAAFWKLAQAGEAGSFAETLPLLAQLTIKTPTRGAPVTIRPTDHGSLRTAGTALMLGETPLQARLPRGRYAVQVGQVSFPLLLERDATWRIDKAPSTADRRLVPVSPTDAGRMTPFEIGTREITAEKYYAYLATLSTQEAQRRLPIVRGKTWPQTCPPEERNRPVRGVTWLDAMSYALWVGARLPSVLEWRRAYGREDGRTLPWGNEPPFKTQTDLPSAGTPKIDRSPYGVLGLAGGVREWCGRPDRSQKTLVQGGSWLTPPSKEWRIPASRRTEDIGFRIARSVLDGVSPDDPAALAQRADHRFYGVQIEALRLLAKHHPTDPHTAGTLFKLLEATRPVAMAARFHLFRQDPQQLAQAVATRADEQSPKKLFETVVDRLGTAGAYPLLLLLAHQPKIGKIALETMLDRLGQRASERIHRALAHASPETRSSIRRELQIHKVRYFQKASELIRRRDSVAYRSEILQLFTRVLGLDPTLKEAHLSRGRMRQTGLDGQIYGKGADLSGALADFSALLRIDPQFVPAIYERAGIHLAREEYKQALKDVRLLQQTRQDDPVLLFLAGRLYYHLKRYPEAVASLSGAIPKLEDGPNRQLAMHFLSRSHSHQGQHARAIAIARLLIEKARNTAALLDLGDALARAGEKKQAAAVYREILSNPKLSRRSRQEIGQRLKALEN